MTDANTAQVPDALHADADAHPPHEPLVTPAICIVIRPELKDSNIERERLLTDSADRTVWWGLNARFPPDASELHAVEHRGLVGTIRACAESTVTTAVVPEPMWIRYWPRTVAVVATARLIRLAFRRPRLTVSLYAIDNLPPAERMTLPRLDRLPTVNRWFGQFAAWAVRRSLPLIVDRIAFGTSAAQRNYEALGVDPSSDKLETACIHEVHGLCRVCFATPAAKPPPPDKRSLRVLFIADFAPRKGLETLIKAWQGSNLSDQGWELMLCGNGALAGTMAGLAKLAPSITVAHPDRHEVHELLRNSRAVVLPSERVPRWREQIGLSMLEGEAHGCALIVSDESGAAYELRDRAHARVVAAGDASDLTTALNELTTARPAEPTADDSIFTLRHFLRDGRRV